MSGVFLFCCSRNHVGELGHLEVAGKAADTLVGELHDTRSGGKQGVVLAFQDVFTGADRAAALTHDDITGLHKFTGVFLYAQALTLGIAAVTCRTASLFMSHKTMWEMGARLRYSF